MYTQYLLLSKQKYITGKMLEVMQLEIAYSANEIPSRHLKADKTSEFLRNFGQHKFGKSLNEYVDALSIIPETKNFIINSTIPKIVTAESNLTKTFDIQEWRVGLCY